MDYDFITEGFKQSYIKVKVESLEREHFKNALEAERADLERRYTYEGASLTELEDQINFYKSKLAEYPAPPKPRDPSIKYA